MKLSVAERTCRACRSRKSKTALLRLVIHGDLALEADPRQVEPGRGYYLCPAEPCLSIIKNPKMLRKAFGRPVQVGTSLQTMLNNPPVGGMHGQNTCS